MPSRAPLSTILLAPLALLLITHAGALAQSASPSLADGPIEPYAAPSGRAPEGVWKELDPAGDELPAPRMGYHASYDPSRRQMIVFGGWGFGAFDDVWSLGLENEQPVWKRLETDGRHPSARLEHTTIYDPVRDRIILFGGKDDRFFGDTWELTLGPDPRWNLLVPEGEGPSPRESRAVYDPVRDRMLISCGFGWPFHLNETWELTLGANPAWRQIMPEGDLPPPRRGQSLIYDPVGDRLLLFGGYDDYAFMNDLWALNLSPSPRWERLDAAGVPPSPRYGHSATYDVNRREMVVFGGYGGTFLDDTHVLMLTDVPMWKHLRRSDPGVRDFHTVVYDPTFRRIVLFAGNRHDILYNDVWAMNRDEDPGDPGPPDDSLAVGAGRRRATPGPRTDSATPLRSVSARPGGRLIVSLAPSSHDARIEVFDVTGRRLSARSLGESAGREREVEVGSGLRPGIYLVRLSDLGRSFARRAIVLP